MKEDKNALKRNVELTAHKEELSSLLAKFNVNPNVGLDTEDAKKLLEEHGPNMLTPPKHTPAWVSFIKELTGFFSLLLWGGAILCFIGYSIDRSEDHLFLGLVLIFVVIVTGVFSYVQNSKSESLMNSFKNMLPPKVKVIRDGSSDEVLALNLVPGDIVFVEGGDLIPADLRVLECSSNFHVDNAPLTGESEPQMRKSVCTHDDPLETQNLCFFGTQVPEGSCKGLVISTGDNTVMGRIAALTMSTKKEQTPINKEIHHFILIISAIAISLGILFFVLNIIIGTPHIENLVFMIGIIVANVPEGLLATVTVCLTLTAKRMHAKKVLIKNLEGVETLGSTSCICSDKTGTLTQNIMTVAKVVYGGDQHCGIEDAPSSFTGGHRTLDSSNSSFQKLLRCASLCNVATFAESSKWEYEEDGNTKKLDDYGNSIPKPFSGCTTQGDGSKIETVFWRPVGNASECAMIKLVQAEASISGASDVETMRSNYPIKCAIPFNSKNKYQLHVHENATTRKHYVMMKGAPERILNRCTHVMLNGNVVEMTKEEREKIESHQEYLSADGLRCLGFAEKELSATYSSEYEYLASDETYNSPNFPSGDSLSEGKDSLGRKQNPKSTEGLVFLGIMALVDPPRPAVPAAVDKCKTAGVKVIMVTGDHPATAQAIAYKVGILWSKTRGDMERDNEKFGRSPSDCDYENPDDADAIVVAGHTISIDMPEEKWDFILSHSQIVFARTSPQQKLVIVENNQRLGHIVAVTGDGVNDSPAIKKADIGIAMGIMGSEVTKNAADMILLDDNFASIVKGIEEGRLIFDNLKKSIAYTIQSNIPEITPFLVFILFAVPLPLTTFLILAIDLGTDMIPAISMAYEYPEADIMMRPPRRSKEDRLVTKKMIHFSYGQIGMIQAMAGFFTYMVVLNDYGYPPNILMSRGNNEAWGHQPLFCQFQGGNYVNVDGTIDIDRNPSIDAPSRQFPFWSADGSGHIQSCYYAVNDFSNAKSPGDNFDFRDATTYIDGTIGHHTPTIESIEANEENKYFEYIPWRARRSAFWNDKFLYWDTDHVNSPGLIGEGVEPALYFGGSPMGLWSLCAFKDDTICDGGSFCESGGSARVRGIATPNSIEMTPLKGLVYSNCENQTTLTYDIYEHAQFCSGQSDDALSCQKSNGYEVDSNGDIQLGYPNNRFQNFYCMGFNSESDNVCGPLTDAKNDLPFCTAEGEECGYFYNNTKEGCDYMCKDFCYWPGSNATNPITGETSDIDYTKWGKDPQTREYRQCRNIASAEVAWESLKHAQGAFFGSIVVGQIAGLLVCKTRWLSIATQGMGNSFMLFGIGTEILLVAWLAYCTPINKALGTRNIRLVHWFCAIPFAILIFVFDECRKALMRSTSSSKTDPTTGQVTRVPGWIEKHCAF